MDFASLIGSTARHVLTAGAGVLVTKGFVDADTANQLVGLGMGVVGLGWSYFNKKKA